MIKSMTAFARRESHAGWGDLSMELRAVNHRFLDLGLRLPEELRCMEGMMRERLVACLGRGKVECTVRLRLRPGGDGADLQLDEALAGALLAACELVAARLPRAAPVSPLEVLQWPGVVAAVVTDSERLQRDVLALLDACLEELNAMRLREGAQIQRLIEQRCTALCERVAAVRARLPEVLAHQRERLRSRVAELQVEVDAERFEQELAYLAQKLDVEEELDRIELHVVEVRRALARDEPVGRRLDFLMQELHREANTLASKSMDARLTQAAVDMKVLIEQMREQVQNVE